MNGMSISDLRDAGARVRHAHGINTCARCNTHFLPSSAAASGPSASPRAKLPCFAHSSAADSSASGVYACCNGGAGTRGCCPAEHLPMFAVDAQGKVEGNSKVQYTKDVLLINAADFAVQPKLVASSSAAPSSPSPSSAPVAAAAPSDAAAAAPGVDAQKLRPTPLGEECMTPAQLASVGAPVPRVGDEIMVCGQLYHTGTPIILWGDVGGYDHYRVERRFCPFEESSWAATQKAVPSFSTPNRYGLRKDGLSNEEVEKVRGGQWDLPTLQKQMKHFVLHYDECGLSRECFRILQDHRDLSVHFMLDIDGTIYQALDLKERAWHATTSNTCGVGVEIANVGAYDPHGPNPFAKWYAKNAQGQTVITIPPQFGDGGVRTPGFVGQPARPEPVQGVIQGQNLVQYDFTPQQYAALSKLIATFCTVFPSIPARYPTDASGSVITRALGEQALQQFRGVLAHYHIQSNKIDPGPAMQWELLVKRAQEIMHRSQAEKDSVQRLNMQQMQLSDAAAPGGSPSSSSSSNSQSGASQSLLRKSERRLLQLAEDAAAQRSNSAEGKSDLFYFVPLAWQRALHAWLHGGEASARPCAVPTQELLEADERSVRAGLQLGVDYGVLHPLVWREVVELYGVQGAPVVRATADIYGGKLPPRRQPEQEAAAAPAYAEETEGWAVV